MADTYYLVSSDGVKMILWGDSTSQQDIEEAIPVALFPPAVPEDLAKDFLTMITMKDPEGLAGKAVKAHVEAQLQAEQASVEMTGLAPGEQPPEDAEVLTQEDVAGEGPFVV